MELEELRNEVILQKICHTIGYIIPGYYFEFPDKTTLLDISSRLLERMKLYCIIPDLNCDIVYNHLSVNLTFNVSSVSFKFDHKIETELWN